MKKSEQLIADLLVIGRMDPTDERLRATEQRVRQFLDELLDWAAEGNKPAGRVAGYIRDAIDEIGFVLQRDELAEPVREVLGRAYDLLPVPRGVPPG
jgi:hypothetical protein